ncbi:MAG TPA: DUF340 domain-containing protein [Bacillota bacterium]|nr:DUF340 domain-containing protein [Bacillota bacterium]
MEKWITRIKVLVITALFASCGNTINTWVAKSRSLTPDKVKIFMPWDVWPALALMLAIVIVGLIISDFFKAKFPKADLPNILFISMIAILVGIPGLSPLATFMKVEFAKIGLLPLCTPILAYAGISIGKDLPAFKRQGVAIVCVALLTFVGTFLGSAIIAEVVLRATGQV